MRPPLTGSHPPKVALAWPRKETRPKRAPRRRQRRDSVARSVEKLRYVHCMSRVGGDWLLWLTLLAQARPALPRPR